MSHLPALRRSHPGHYKPWLSRVASCRSCLARSLLGQVASPVVLFPSRRELPRAGQGDPMSADDTAPPSLPSWYGLSRAVFVRGITCLPQGNGPRIYVKQNEATKGTQSRQRKTRGGDDFLLLEGRWGSQFRLRTGSIFFLSLDRSIGCLVFSFARWWLHKEQRIPLVLATRRVRMCAHAQYLQKVVSGIKAESKSWTQLWSCFWGVEGRLTRAIHELDPRRYI